MQAKDFMYEQIYKGSLKSGASERAALDAATTGVDDWKKCRGGKKPFDIIKKKIAQAKKATRK